MEVVGEIATCVAELAAAQAEHRQNPTQETSDAIAFLRQKELFLRQKEINAQQLEIMRLAREASGYHFLV
jgi:hypothetical protein